MEGLLSAFARTSEDDIDGGRWTMEVPTADGARSFTLCIPPLLAPVDAPPGPARTRPDRRTVERALVEVERFVGQLSFEDPDAVNEAVRRRFTGPVDAVPSTATTPLERAQELMYRAFEATGRRRIQLARRALALSPDCADAHVALAEHASDPDQARAHYAAGVAAGERALGPEVFAGDAGHFWSRVATRPYMRARFGLAQCLEETGRTEEALPHYRDLLRLDPEDHLGVRHVLLAALLAAGHDDEAGALLTRYDQAPDAVWAYGAALWTFRREGDGAEARARLAAARRANRHAPPHLTGEAEWEAELPETYAYGSEEEAVLCAALLRAPWQATPGAEAWLRAQAGHGGGRARRRRR
jgi:hypothetical protein